MKNDRPFSPPIVNKGLNDHVRFDQEQDKAIETSGVSCITLYSCAEKIK